MAKTRWTQWYLVWQCFVFLKTSSGSAYISWFLTVFLCGQVCLCLCICMCFVCFSPCLVCPHLVCLFVLFSNEKIKGVDLGGWGGSGRSFRDGKLWSEYTVWKKNLFSIKKSFGSRWQPIQRITGIQRAMSKGLWSAQLYMGHLY